MCEKTVVLTLFFILKIVILLIIPIFFFINKKTSYKRMNILFYIEISLIALLIVLRLTNNSCIVRSTINGIKINMNKNSSEYIVEDNDPNDVTSIETNKKYKSNTSKNVYYFNNNQLPLSNKKIACPDNGEAYMKNYGNSITSISMLLSSYFDKNIDPIEVLNLYLEKNNIDCDNGINFDALMNNVSEKYGVNFISINKPDLFNEISRGNIVLADIKNVDGANNITCNRGYVIIYNVDNGGNYHVLYSNDSTKEILCSNLSKIDGNLSSKEWDKGSLDLISNRYFKIERK